MRSLMKVQECWFIVGPGLIEIDIEAGVTADLYIPGDNLGVECGIGTTGAINGHIGSGG